MAKALIFIGTRPELVKMAPVIFEMKKRGLRDRLLVVNTGQHKETMQNTFRYLGIEPDAALDLMVPGQSLNELFARALLQMQDLLSSRFKSSIPDLIMAQGDTSTACAAAMSALHNRIPFLHVEAGLRTYNMEHPFPEEFYRRIISQAAIRHYTPTLEATGNLLREGTPAERILQTGNTVVDALGYIQKLRLYREASNLPAALLHEFRKGKKNHVLITCHRRENFGEPLQRIIRTTKELATKHPELRFIWVMHPNPSVKKAVERSGLHALTNVVVIPPVDYFDMISLYPHLKTAITDSGGIQEEAPSFGIPVIVLRNVTERVESIKKGYAFLCGSSPSAIRASFERCLADPPQITENPYGDGKASKRICDDVCLLLNIKPKITTITNGKRKAKI